jgi:DMSO/TMAO reductase YedYZ heme-binding membrane subunit
MIPMTIYAILLAITLAWTVGVVYLGVQGSVGDKPINRRIGILLSAIGLVLWGVVGISSFEVVSYSGGQTFEHSLVGIGYFSVAGGALMLFSMLQGTVEELNETGGI